MRTIFARIHCNFRRMFPFRSFFAESELRMNICRIFADSINVAQNTHKRYRRPKIVRFACSNHVTSRGRLIRVAVEQKRHLFRKFLGCVSRSCRVCPHALRDRRGLKIYLCRGPASTGAIGAAESYAKIPENVRKILETYVERYRHAPRSRKLPCCDPP